MLSSYELTLTSVEELEDKLNQIPTNSKIHLPDKPNNYPNLELAKQIEQREIAITFSVRCHYFGGKFELIVEDLNRYLELINTNSNISELLIVSGPSARKIDSLDILNYIFTTKIKVSIRSDLTISVAYNCNCKDQIRENNRLNQKLKCDLVQKVYVQITDDIEKIVSGINFIRSLNPKIRICVCIFEPSASSLAKFKFRPWKGVVLSEGFLSDFKAAKVINQKNLDLLDTFKTEIIYTT
jgi:hypothetical protein